MAGSQKRRRKQMAAEQQNKRPPTPSGESNSSSSSKGKASPAVPSSPVSGVMVKQEAQEREDAQAGRPSRARSAAMEQTNTPAELPRVYGGMEVRLLHCAVAECNRPLKPPLFKCEAGHRLCGDCRGDGRCRRCGLDATFFHCGPDLDEYVGSFTVPCAFESHGCGSAVVYHEVAAHRDACVYAPCSCVVAGCAFTGSPPILRDHLAGEHAWPVHVLPGYGRSVQLRVPSASESWLLVVEGDERRLFMMSVRARGAPRCWAVTVACVRASGAAEAGPWYQCVLWAQAPAVPDVSASMMMETDVVSYGGAGAALEEMALVVPPPMLRGPSKEIHLVVRINVLNVNPAPASQLPAAVC